MIDPELGLLLCHQVSHARHRAYGLFLIEIAAGHVARFPICLEVNGITGQQHGACLRREDVASDLAFVRVRGTKRKTRDRILPIVTEDQRSLLKYALEHAQGENGLLFLDWQNVRRDLRAACTKLKIPRCSPNDLRRTCATWLRAAGTPPHLIAPLMGHADSRMVERVYGCLEPAALAQLIANVTGSTQQDLSRRSQIGWHSVDRMDSEPRESPRKWLPELGSNQRPTD